MPSSATAAVRRTASYENCVDDYAACVDHQGPRAGRLLYRRQQGTNWSNRPCLRRPAVLSRGRYSGARRGSIVVDGNPIPASSMPDQSAFLNDAYLLVVRQADPTVSATISAPRRGQRLQQLDQNRESCKSCSRCFTAWCRWWCCSPPSGQALGGQPAGAAISGLIDAAERVSAGDLDAQVRVARDDDELAGLSRAFNRMTSSCRRSAAI